MSMLIPGQNQLAEPEIVKVEVFEDLLAEFKTFVVEYVGARAPDRAAKLKVSLENESELLTMALEAFCVRLQTHERKYNARIKQMLAWWATGSNLDARLADMGLERQLLDPGDPTAFPPIPPLYESDDDARLRYYLAPHAPAAGSRMQYRREVFTLGERPSVKVENTSPGVVAVTYTFDPDGYAAQVKDGNGRRTAPGPFLHAVATVRRRPNCSIGFAVISPAPMSGRRRISSASRVPRSRTTRFASVNSRLTPRPAIGWRDGSSRAGSTTPCTVPAPCRSRFSNRVSPLSPRHFRRLTARLSRLRC